MTSTTEYNRASPVGSWRVGYAPGDWLVASGPASLVAVSPGVASASVTSLWESVVAARDIDALLGGLAKFGTEQVPGLAVFFWADSELRTLVRGDVRITDGTGAPIVPSEGVRTWTETGLGGVRDVVVGLGQAPVAADLLPLVVGVVRASELRLDASDEALVLSPQHGTPAAAGTPAPAASPPVAQPPAASPPTVVPSAKPDVAPVLPPRLSKPARPSGQLGPTPYSEARAESSTPPEPESQAPYPKPEREPNGATAPEIAASSPPTEPRPARTWDSDLPETVIGPSLGVTGSSAGPAGADHLGQSRFGGRVPSFTAGVAAQAGLGRPGNGDLAAPNTGALDPGGLDLSGGNSSGRDAGGIGSGARGGDINDADRTDTGALDIGAPDTETPDAGGADAAVSGAAEPNHDVVLAVLCQRGHPNPPDMRFCRWCRSTIERQQPQTIAAPVLAVLRPSIGDTVPLRQPVVIGRAPSAARVADSSAFLLTVPSPSQDISRSHVQITPEGWDVTVTDLQSTNGTILIAPGTGADRRRLLPGQPVTVEPGSVLDLGDGVTVAVDAPSS